MNHFFNLDHGELTISSTLRELIQKSPYDCDLKTSIQDSISKATKEHHGRKLDAGDSHVNIATLQTQLFSLFQGNSCKNQNLLPTKICGSISVTTATPLGNCRYSFINDGSFYMIQYSNGTVSPKEQHCTCESQSVQQWSSHHILTAI